MNRAVTTQAMMISMALAYVDAERNRFRQSSNGAVSNSSVIANTAYTPDRVARRQRSRMLSRSCGDTLAVSSGSPDGAWTSKVAPSAAAGAPSNGNWIDTGASIVG